jgi:hypothetical protein
MVCVCAQMFWCSSFINQCKLNVVALEVCVCEWNESEECQKES